MRTVLAAVAALTATSLAAVRGEVFFRGEPLEPGSGKGWSFRNGELRLSGAENAAVSGTATNGEVRIVVESSTALALDGLSLAAPETGACALSVARGASLELSLSGTNSFVSGPARAGIEVPSGAALRVAAATDAAAARLEVRGGSSAAGIGGHGGFGDGGPAGDAEFSGAVEIVACGGANAAGIGGGWGGAGGGVSVSGGARLTAVGGWNAPGIGGGRDGTGARLAIASGRVETRGGSSAPGFSGTMEMAGGFVAAAAGPGSAEIPDVALSRPGPGALVIGGGSLRAAGGKVSGKAVAPDGTPLFPVSVPLGTNSAAALSVPGWPVGDLSMVEPDGSGSAVLWLPVHVSAVSLAGETVAVRDPPPETGVFVGGVDVSSVSGPGWFWTEPELSLRGEGPFVLSGTNVDGRVRIRVEAGRCAIAFDGLVLDCARSGAPAACVASGAVAKVELRGRSVLRSGAGSAGFQVDDGGEVVFLSGHPGASLEAAGGANGAGIGGGEYGSGGRIGFAATNATVDARGGRRGAGVGGGSRATAGAVSVLAGDVFATGGAEAAGMGGGAWGGGAEVSVSGGFVKSVAGEDGSGIGGGKFGPGGSLCVTGGTVLPFSGTNAWTVGGGAGASEPPRGTVEVTGGSLVAGALRVSPAPTRAGDSRLTRRGRVADRLPLRRVAAYLDLTNAPVEVSGLSGYGVSDVRGDGSGNVVFWLPWGDHEFSLPDGRRFAARVAPDVPAAPFRPATGIRVGGIEVAGGGGRDWAWDGHDVSFNGDGPFVVSGTCEDGRVSLRVPPGNSVDLVFSNLVVAAAPEKPAFAAGRGSRVDVDVLGECRLSGGAGAPAAAVGADAKLRLSPRKTGSAPPMLEFRAGSGARSALGPDGDGAFGTVSLGRGFGGPPALTPDSGSEITVSVR